ncbi:MAG: ABC transporter ATP-binding protein [Gammaproteobacteria bacterium]
MSGLIEACGLGVARGERRLIKHLDFVLAPGELVAVVGPNGAGKSSLLTTLAGLFPPATGEARLEGTALERLPRRTIARRLGFLAQDSDDPYPATVLETALIGRHPHIDFWRWESDADRARARKALRAVGLGAAATRSVATLSGGERRRLAIATLLTQAPRIYLLDEPLEALDLAFQMRLLRLLRHMATLGGVGVLFSLHDLSLAARYAERVILLDGQGSATLGTPAMVLDPARLSTIYGCRIRRIAVDGTSFYMAE